MSKKLEIVSVICQVKNNDPDLIYTGENISGQLFDHCRDWKYSTEAEATDTMNKRLDVLLEAYHPTTAAAIRESVVFIPVIIPLKKG